MATGNLLKKRVPPNFTPACSNCQYYRECAVNPRHPAYPHRWHWSHETITLPDGSRLIVDSWIGTIAKGQPHTGCSYYTVDPQILLPTTPAMTHLVKARTKMEQLFQQASKARRAREQNRLWNQYDRAEHEYEQLLRSIEQELNTDENR